MKSANLSPLSLARARQIALTHPYIILITPCWGSIPSHTRASDNGDKRFPLIELSKGGR